MADEPETSERSAVQPLEVDASAVVEKKAPVQLVKEDVALTNSPGVKECGNIGKALVARPCIIFWAGIVLILVLTMVATPNMVISENVGPSYDFTPNDNPAVMAFDAISAADKSLDSLSGADKPKERSAPDLNFGFMQYLYQGEKEGEEVFTVDNVQKICNYESQIFNHDGYKDFCILNYPTGCENTTCASCAAPALSIAHLFYGADIYDSACTTAVCTAKANLAAYYMSYSHSDGNTYKVSSMASVTRNAFNFSKCDKLSAWKVKATREWLYTEAKKSSIVLPIPNAPPLTGSQLYGFYLEKDSLTLSPPRTSKSRSFIQLGSPPKGFKDSNDDAKGQMEHFWKFWLPVQEYLFKKFDAKTTFFKSPYRQLDTTDGDLNVKWLGLLFFNRDATATANNDFSMVVFSVLFVWFWISVHTGSFFIGSIGIFQIMLSVPVSFFFYYFVFQITYFAQTHILAIFIILGVGADDVFVLVDGWKQSREIVKRKNTEVPEEKDTEYLSERMAFAYHRTYRAVLNTSLTTAMAFVGTGISPLMGFSTFGWFAAICIILNYVLVITFTPAALLVQEMYISPFLDRTIGSKVAYCRRKRDVGDEASTAEKGGEQKDGGHKAGCLSNLYVPYMTKAMNGKKWLKPLPIAIIVILVANTIQASVFTSLLTPPTEEEEWVKEDHMMAKWNDKTRGMFLGDEDNDFLQGRFVFGITGIDRTGFNRFDTLSTFRGNPVFDDKFEIHSQAAQEALLSFCQTVETYKCKDNLRGCGSTDTLARPGSVRCWIREFQSWHKAKYANATTYGLNETTFLDRLTAFRQTEKPAAAQAENWKKSIGLINGKLKYVAVRLRINVQSFDPQSVKFPMYKLFNKVVDDFKKEAPAGLGSVLHESSFFGWVFMSTEQALVQSLFNGLGFSFPIAALVLLYATRNWVTAAFAIFSVGSVVVSVLGFCKAYMGWSLGVTETFAGIIVVGLAVDYVVHQAHMYEDAAHCEHHFQTREERFTHSATKMGSTVIAGAITTAGSGCFMFLCQLGFFYKMAVLIVVTIMWSFIYSMGLFLSLCVVMGPEGEFANITTPPCLKNDGDKKEGSSTI
eukprot:g1572.t1